MTREEKCKLAILKGYTYDSDTGHVLNKHGQMLKANCNGYIIIGKLALLAHHFAWYNVYGNCNTDQIDHINGIKDDNRIFNLRNVNSKQNAWNRKAVKGFSFKKSHQKYVAQITINSKRKHLGLFDTEEEARNAYLKAKEKYHLI